jgi:hypothetical protein
MVGWSRGVGGGGVSRGGGFEKEVELAVSLGGVGRRVFCIGVSVEGLDVTFAEELKAVGEALGIGERGTFAIGAEE